MDEQHRRGACAVRLIPVDKGGRKHPLSLSAHPGVGEFLVRGGTTIIKNLKQLFGSHRVVEHRLQPRSAALYFRPRIIELSVAHAVNSRRDGAGTAISIRQIKRLFGRSEDQVEAVVPIGLPRYPFEITGRSRLSDQILRHKTAPGRRIVPAGALIPNVGHRGPVPAARHSEPRPSPL